MKNVKFLLLAIAALMLAACSSDDDNNNQNGEQPEPNVEFTDYSSVIGMSYTNMIRQYPNPDMQFGDYYSYNLKDGKVESLTIALNPENQTVYLVMETLAEGAYQEKDVHAFFSGKYTFYGKTTVETSEMDEETGEFDDTKTVEISSYTYGNTAKQEDATLLITYTSTGSITYTNPKNQPEEPEYNNVAMEDLTPIEAIDAFIMKELEDIEEEYPGAFINTYGMYMASIEDNEWLMAVALTTVDDFVTSVTILFNEEKTDEEICQYFTENGYTVTPNGTNEEESPKYLFTNGPVQIEYSDARAVVNYQLDF